MASSEKSLFLQNQVLDLKLLEKNEKLFKAEIVYATCCLYYTMCSTIRDCIQLFVQMIATFEIQARLKFVWVFFFWVLKFSSSKVSTQRNLIKTWLRNVGRGETPILNFK